jgi:hypothetical protein
MVSLHHAKKIGLLAMVGSAGDLTRVIDFGETLKSYGSEVKGLAYVPSGQIPAYFESQDLFEVITSKDLNLAGIPRGQKVKRFCDVQYDFLIDLTIAECLPLFYIAGIGHARIKAGRYTTQGNNVYDFMIADNGENNIGDFSHSMKKYLSQINITQA